MNYGFRILPSPSRPDLALVEKFQHISTPLISDSMNRLSGVDASIRSYHQAGKLAGTALTVKTRPGDNLMVHKAIDLTKPGDVLIVDAGGELSHAIIGEIMMRLAEKNGAAGIVIDGAIRDAGIISKGNFPVYAKGVTHRGPYKDGPGEINVPVSIGGMLINPGDIIVGDEDGLAVVPAGIAEEVYYLAKERQSDETRMLQEIEDGTLDRRWVDEVLKERDCGGLGN